MAREIIWTQTAQEELREILRYIAQDSLDVAINVNDRILSRVEHLSEFPLVGHFIPEIESTRYRQLTVYRYRIIYRVERETVYVVAVIHGARDFRKAFGNRAAE